MMRLPTQYSEPARRARMPKNAVEVCLDDAVAHMHADAFGMVAEARTTPKNTHCLRSVRIYSTFRHNLDCAPSRVSADYRQRFRSHPIFGLSPETSVSKPVPRAATYILE